MEASLDDLLGPDEDNQDGSVSSVETNPAEASVARGNVELLCDLPEVWHEAVAHAPDQSTRSMELPPRKVHSAAATSAVYGLGGGYEDIPRPYTSAGLDDHPSSSSRLRTKNKSAVRKKTARDDEAPRAERPRSAGLDGWGDFDTDRLLRDDPDQDQSNQTLDPLDGKRSRSRKSRRATPTTSSPRPNPWEGYLVSGESKESSKPPMQVLRQKPIEILNLDLVALANQPSGRPGTSSKPLLGRASFERLISPHSSNTSVRPTTPTALFGTEIRDTPKNRAAIFARFAALWTLISHHSADQPPESQSSDTPDRQTRSAVECSTTMVKICKTVGISLTPSSATRLSFWNTHENGIDFESFCDLVIQGAIQPALRHFNLDNSVDEYVSALDTIVQSLLTTAPARRRKNDILLPRDCPSRLKDLNEIQPVFLSWKAGITPRSMQPTEDAGPPPTRALVTAEKVRRALEASVSQRMLAHQLPSEEARVTHVENIRRKVQLHKSWKCSSDGSVGEGGINSPKTAMSRGRLPSSHEDRSAVSRTAQLSAMFEHAHLVFPTSAGMASDEVFPQEEGDRPELVVEQSTGSDAKDTISAGTENDEVLVCCSCSVRAAVLWCSSCFTVTCRNCWQEVHSCIVDMSMVSSTSSSAKKPLLGPTTLAIQKKRCGSATLRPPIAMIYLPTKAIVPGTLARGNPIVRLARKSPNQATSGGTKDEAPAIVVSAMLPSLHKSCSDSKIPRHYERPKVENETPPTDSTADLVKSLMLRMSPTPGSRSTGSMETVMRPHKQHAPTRGKLHLAPVTLEAELLLAHTPDRRR
ncbi:hypothetical protein PRIC2_014414 [Phytophthora ramorum]